MLSSTQRRLHRPPHVALHRAGLADESLYEPPLRSESPITAMSSSPISLTVYLTFIHHIPLAAVRGKAHVFLQFVLHLFYSRFVHTVQVNLGLDHSAITCWIRQDTCLLLLCLSDTCSVVSNSFGDIP
eukprot:SAG22_NODE_1666_length_3859_cov_292.311702_3_plen_128_part_00